MALTVASMLTTTPFFRPLDSCPPMPMMFNRLSGSNSATIATTLEVPISRPTTRFLFSLLMPPPPFPFRNSYVATVGVRRQSRTVASPHGAPAPCSCRLPFAALVSHALWFRDRMHDLGYAQRKSVGVAQVDVVEPAIEAPDRLRVESDKAREPLQHRLLQLIPPQFQREAVRQPHLPGIAGREQHLAQLEPERR